MKSIFFFYRKKNSVGPPAPIQPVTREYDQNVMFRNNNSVSTNNYGEPHEIEKAPEFNGRPEPRIHSPLQNEDGQMTKLLQTSINSYFTYNRVPWKLNIRKEVSHSFQRNDWEYYVDIHGWNFAGFHLWCQEPFQIKHNFTNNPLNVKWINLF